MYLLTETEMKVISEHKYYSDVTGAKYRKESKELAVITKK